MDYRYGLRFKEDDAAENEKDYINSATLDDSKGAAKKGAPHTRGTAISFGFRRRSRGDGNQMSVANSEADAIPPRSKSVGPEQVRRRIIDDDVRHQRVQSASSGRSTPRLAPPKKEAASGGLTNVRTNRFGFRQPPQTARYTDKVADVCTSHSASHFNQECASHISRPPSRGGTHATPPCTKLRPSPVHNQPAYEMNRRTTGIPEPISRYTLHTSHLPQPQYAVRVTDTNTKIAKTAVNQSRKVSTASKGSGGSQSGSGTEDSGISSQPGYLVDNEAIHGIDYVDGASPGRRGHGRPRNLRMVVSGKSFDVRDVDDDSTVTEISVIPLPKSFATVNLGGTGLVRERTTQYQRILNKDNRYTESTTSMSTTSSEGYDEGLGEEKVYKDRSHSEKVPSIKSDFSPLSSDDPEYGHGEAMADEYSFSSNDEYRRNHQHLKTTPIPAKSGALPKTTLRSVMLTIEDPAFAAAAATSTTLIDDETSPVDSLVDSLTASTQSDGQQSKKERIVEKMGINIDDESPGTPTNASNSLSLSEGREYFDDEIADQPGLTFDDTIQGGHEILSGRASQLVTDNSHTLIESTPKTHLLHGKSVEHSPMNNRRIIRTGSVDTLSPCESITSDDLMLDYERSEASSYDESNRRLESSSALHELDDATILSELEAQGEEVMREWSSLLGTHPQHSNSNLANNNVNSINNNANNNNQTTESGIGSIRTSRLVRNRPGTDSPRSLDSGRTRQIASPFRPVLTGNGQSPNLDSGDEGSPRLERCNYHQDIVYIKTGLLKLMRVVQESEEKDLTRAETLNPFNNTMNGLFHNLNEEGTTNSDVTMTNTVLNVADELADLRRQVIFLQGQVEDKDRAIQHLQLQVAKQQDLINSADSQSSASTFNMSTSKDMANAATQTEKIRPVSAGPSLLQGFPQDSSMGPLVSWSEPWHRNNDSSQRPSSVEVNSKNHRITTIGLSKTTKSRQESVARLNGSTEKISDNLSNGKMMKNRDKVASKIIETNNVKENVSKTEIPKSCIPSLKKVPALKIIPRGARGDVFITNRLHNS